MVTYFNKADREALLKLKAFLVDNNYQGDIIEISDIDTIIQIKRLFQNENKKGRLVVQISVKNDDLNTPLGLFSNSGGVQAIVQETLNKKLKIRNWLLEAINIFILSKYFQSFFPVFKLSYSFAK